MKFTEKIRAKSALHKLAKKEGTTPKAIRASMQEAIDAAWATDDTTEKATQSHLFPNGKPSLEAFIARISEIISVQQEW